MTFARSLTTAPFERSSTGWSVLVAKLVPGPVSGEVLATEYDEMIQQGLKLAAPPITGTNQGAEHIPRAPRSLIRTTHAFKQSAIARDWFGDTFVEHFAATREWEHRQWRDAVTDWERKRYFEII